MSAVPVALEANKVDPLQNATLYVVFTLIGTVLILITAVAVIYKTFTKPVGKEFNLDDLSLQQEAGAADAHVPVIYFATQSGNSEKYANRLADHFAPKFGQFEVCDVADLNPSRFISRRVAIFVVSTYGEGECPDSAKPFSQWLDTLIQAGVHKLPHLRFAILGLGDSSYVSFNGFADHIQTALLSLNATQIVPTHKADSQSGTEEDYLEWISSPSVQKIIPAAFEQAAKQAGAPPPSAASTKPPAFDAITLQSSPSPATLTAPFNTYLSRLPPNKREGPSTASRLLFQVRPVNVLQVTQARLASSPINTTVLVDLTLPYEDRKTYATGGNVDVLPPTSDNVINWFKALFAPSASLDDSIAIALTPAAAADSSLTNLPPPPFPMPCTVREALGLYTDLLTLPDHPTLVKLAAFLADDKEKQALDRMLNDPAKFAGMVRNGELKSVSFGQFAAVFMQSLRVPSLLEALYILPRQRPRAYTGASSTLKTPSSVTLLVSLDSSPYNHQALLANLTNLRTTFKFPIGDNTDSNVKLLFDAATFSSPDAPHLIQGLTSTHLNTALMQGNTLHIKTGGSNFTSLRRATLTTPAAGPVVMVATGSGFAPMIGLLEENFHLRTTAGVGIGVQSEAKKQKNLLFFGCRYEGDVLCKARLDSMLANGTLSHLDVAVSSVANPTGASNRYYVQHAIERRANIIVDAIANQNGSIVMCGGTSMGASVEETLARILPGGKAAVAQLKTEGRFVTELWSSA